MRKSILLAIALTACSRNPGPGASSPGAVAPRQAAVQFLAAVKAQDLQAMSSVWGTDKGLAREQLDRSQLERRLIIMQGCYDHDRYQILDEVPGTGGTRVIRVTLWRGGRTKTTNFAIYRGPSSRYYLNVENADFSAMRDFCAR